MSVQNKKVFHQSFLFVSENKTLFIYTFLWQQISINLEKKVSLLADIFQLKLMDWSLALVIAVKAKRKNGVIIETELN